MKTRPKSTHAYLIYGQAVTDAEALAAMTIPAHETVVEMPVALRAMVQEEYAGAADH